MMTMETTLQEFDPQTASDADWEALHAFQTRLLAERLPDDPPRPLAHLMAALQNIPPFVDAHFWIIWNAPHTEIVARATLFMLRTEENQHLGQMEVEVLPELRRQGFGRQLLATVVVAARQAGRRLLITNSYGGVPAGAAFLGRIGGTMGIESHTNQLDLTTLDPALLAAWQEQAAARNPDFTLGLWDGPYPEADLPAIVELMEATNLEPHGDLEVEDMHWTAEQLRQQEESLQQRGMERWIMYIRDTTTGTFAGFTELIWNPNKPTVLDQGFTAVWPRYRNRGLGRWLKAAMLAKVLRERPEARYVRTSNADSNAAMLKINQELGFRPYQSDSAWQVDLARAEAYLAERESPPANAHD